MYIVQFGKNLHQKNGPFDAIVSMGSPEHFVSPKEYINGEQDKIYQNFFDYCHKLLKPGGRIGGQFYDLQWERVRPIEIASRKRRHRR